jgi:tetratricopeptide (TPR) repeat protein
VTIAAATVGRHGAIVKPGPNPGIAAIAIAVTWLFAILHRVALCALTVAALSTSGGRAEESVVSRLERQLAAKEAVDGKAGPYLLPAIEQLARAYLLRGDFDEALALRRRALDIAIRAVGCDSAVAAEAMVSLAMLDIDRRAYLDAEPLLLIAQRTLSARADADRPAMVVIYAGLARIALARGDLRPAEGWARHAVAIARRNPHKRSAEPLRVLGAVLTSQQNFQEADTVLAEALAQDRRQHGADGLDTARSLSQLANFYLRRGRPAEALPLLQKAAAIDQARLGPSHPFIADDLYDLGLAYDALGRKADARRAFLAAIAVLERGAGRNTVRVAYAETELSRLYRQAGDADAADTAFRNARRILNKAEADERRRERRA